MRRAVELGSAEAALRQLEIEPTDENFEHAAGLAGVKQAARLAEVALFFGRERMHGWRCEPLRGRVTLRR
ncbi:hypothetical protein ACQ859_11075 [Roseateles chitinivorans]|uniref:hypothetical protein n=1 Tax=Roseateles chitinivorans TaxID=2917965 RepID=UPI003D66AFE0